MKKHSVKIQGHATSISLEEEFWTAIKQLATAQKRNLTDLLAEIDRKRGAHNLSSAIRVYILKNLQDPDPPEKI
ncbi:MAG: aryl-sulfate sulfotransferase [Alphaproteobacteria bacterium CG_4_9_14_3_um_filter_47_13]|nr:MAG: aryl-sulfate sulfotransferase [Alphaproteobacteria bacterium CG_4_9_14_3_um_filter_47_13]